MNTRYDWSNVPSWVKVIATDEDGSVYWYEYPPTVKGSGVWHSGGFNQKASQGPCKDWLNSVELRASTRKEGDAKCHSGNPLEKAPREGNAAPQPSDPSEAAATPPAEPPRPAREWIIGVYQKENYDELVVRGPFPKEGEGKIHVREVLPSVPSPDAETGFKEWWGKNRPLDHRGTSSEYWAKRAWMARQPHINRLFQE